MNFLDELNKIKNGYYSMMIESKGGNKQQNIKDEDKIDELRNENNQLKKEKELIKNKLLTQILDKDMISNSNYNFGLYETIEDLHEMVNDLFKNPYDFEVVYDCDDCDYFTENEEDLTGNCSKHNKHITEIYGCACSDFKWKL